MSKWRTLEDADGKILSAGWTDFVVEDGQKVKEYDDVDKDIVKKLRSNRRKSPIREDLLSVDASTIDDPLMKLVVQALQEKLA